MSSAITAATIETIIEIIVIGCSFNFTLWHNEAQENIEDYAWKGSWEAGQDSIACTNQRWVQLKVICDASTNATQYLVGGLGQSFIHSSKSFVAAKIH